MRRQVTYFSCSLNEKLGKEALGESVPKANPSHEIGVVLGPEIEPLLQRDGPDLAKNRKTYRMEKEI